MTDLTKGGELKALFVFALPIFLGNFFVKFFKKINQKGSRILSHFLFDFNSLYLKSYLL